MRIARSVTRLYWMTIFELKGHLHSDCRVPSDFFVQTPQKIAQNRPVFCVYHQRNKATDELAHFWEDCTKYARFATLILEAHPRIESCLLCVTVATKS